MPAHRQRPPPPALDPPPRETEWSKRAQYTGLTDLPLTVEGEQQAVEVPARSWTGVDFDLVLTSPLRRARPHGRTGPAPRRTAGTAGGGVGLRRLRGHQLGPDPEGQPGLPDLDPRRAKR